jgi:S-DNA-T family DNA segregation ATPase FtsK/SpoIIIE
MDKIQQINSIFRSYKILALCKDYKEINNYCYYDIILEPTARVKDIEKFSTEIGIALKKYGKPSIRLLSELGIIRLEFFNNNSYIINIFDYFYKINPPPGNLQCLLGQNIQGERLWLDLTTSPHMIVSGTTGSGKSTILHTIIANLLNYYDTQIFLMDTKNIEFCEYPEFIKSNLYFASTYNQCLCMLKDLCSIMESRYELLRQQNIYNNLPYIVVIIDEFADLILQDIDNEFYNLLCKLSQKCRASKIHIIISTQRPSVDIICGTIKSNFPVRIACKVASRADSKVILDVGGAENLFGNGDSLLKNNLGKLERFQSAYTSPKEIRKYFE